MSGKTTIAPDALMTIASLAALAVPGVARMGSVPGAVTRLLRRGAGAGVRLEVADNTVTADLHIIVSAEHSVREVSQAVRAEVARAMQEMVGMDVVAVNVTVDDVAYEAAPAQD
jgi:uncharacterized alkaline shock family protein YloU